MSLLALEFLKKLEAGMSQEPRNLVLPFYRGTSPRGSVSTSTMSGVVTWDAGALHES